MRRIIPPRTKIQTNIARNFSLKDLFVLLVFVGFAVLCVSTTFHGIVRLVLALLVLVLGAASIGTYGYFKGYQWLDVLRKFLFAKKSYTSNELQALTELKFEEDLMKLCGAYSCVIEVCPIEFILFKQTKQLQILAQFGELTKIIKTGSIVKLEKPINFSGYLQQYKTRLDEIVAAKQKFVEEEQKKAKEAHKAFDIAKLDLTRFDSAIEILTSAISFLTYNNTDRPIKAEVFYFVLYATSKEQLKNTETDVIARLSMLGMFPKKLKPDELQAFLSRFVEAEDNQSAFTSIKQSFGQVSINNHPKKIFSIAKYPVFSNGNHWASDFFTIRQTTVVLNFSAGNLDQAKKSINKTINELRYRLYGERQATEQQAISDQVEALKILLQQFDYNNEGLSNCNLYFMVDAKPEEYRRIKSVVEPSGFRLTGLSGMQLDAWLSMFPAVKNDLLPEFSRAIQTSTIAAAFPFINNSFADPEGEYIGDYRYPVFFDLWQRNSNRVNSNFCILGQSGNGKTYFQKALLKQQVIKGTRVFVLDCESEYPYMAKKLGGTVIEMTGGPSGVINPFQVFPSFRPTEDDILYGQAREKIDHGDVTNHRLFLSQWFRSLLDLGIDERALLEKVIQEMYDAAKITDYSDLAELKAQDFPTFNTLHKRIEDALKDTKKRSEYELSCLRRLNNYLAVFSGNGNYARLWNGATSLNIVGDFVVFDFQQLFANSNTEICNAQMMLIMRLMMREVINVQKANEGQSKKKKVLVLVDELHRYISKQFPVALDTLYQFAKRIRKYDGALGVATQNVGDLLGASEEVRAMATSIINNCQYNMLFGLKADDINRAQELYANYGDGLTGDEVQFLTTAKRGQMLFLVEPEKRHVVKVSLLPGEEKYLIAT